jgi:hypothetical protein
MKMKNLLLTIAATFGMTALTMAQNVPNYVPTNGLVGWWPFNGNANDESGNSNNGTVNGATLTTDRFLNINAAYNFNGTSDFISVMDNSSLDLLTNQYTLSVWFKIPDYSPCPSIPNGSGVTDDSRTLISKPRNSGWADGSIVITYTPGFPYDTTIATGSWNVASVSSNTIPPLNTWINVVATYNGSSMSIYIDGVLKNTISATGLLYQSSEDLYFGKAFNIVGNNWYRWFKGQLDDIGIWNRALTQQEIDALYNASNCVNNTTITPQTNSLTTGSNATFTATTSDPNPNYVWQSNFGQGFQTLNDFGNYSGTNSGTLSIANVQLPNHTQPIRVITTSANCIDTSNVAIISITDTCINTITDTTLITVTDTLLINTTITSLNPPNNANTIKVFPNPTNDHITINYGNFSVMNGYQLKIENSLGQQVFQTNITQQSDYLNLTSWGGNGLYFVHIIDPQGNTIDIRKIVLQ